MALDKAIASGKERRKPYREHGGKICKANSKSCRNNGSDPSARSNRLHANRRRELNAQDELTYYQEGEE